MSSMRIGMENFNQQQNSQRYWLSEMCSGEKKIPIHKINKRRTDCPSFIIFCNAFAL